MRERSTDVAGASQRNVFRYVLATSAAHQLFLLALMVTVFLLEVVPLELQRRIDRNDSADDDRPIQQAFGLDMGIFKLKFAMNFLMNICSHLQFWSAAGGSIPDNSRSAG